MSEMSVDPSQSTFEMAPHRSHGQSLAERLAAGQAGEDAPRSQSAPKKPAPVRRTREIAGILGLTWGALLFLSLISYHPGDPCWNVVGKGPVLNVLGSFGAYLSDFMLQIFGKNAYIIAVLCLYFAFAMVLQRRLRWRMISVIGYVCIGLLSAGLWHLGLGYHGSQPYSSGGVWGQWLAEQLVALTGNLGAWLLLCVGIALSIVWTTRFSFLHAGIVLTKRMAPGLNRWWLRQVERWMDWRDSMSRWRSRKQHREPSVFVRSPEHQLAVADGIHTELPALELEGIWLEPQAEESTLLEGTANLQRSSLPELTPPEHHALYREKDSFWDSIKRDKRSLWEEETSDAEQVQTRILNGRAAKPVQGPAHVEEPAPVAMIPLSSSEEVPYELPKEKTIAEQKIALSCVTPVSEKSREPAQKGKRARNHTAPLATTPESQFAQVIPPESPVFAGVQEDTLPEGPPPITPQAEGDVELVGITTVRTIPEDVDVLPNSKYVEAIGILGMMDSIFEESPKQELAFEEQEQTLDETFATQPEPTPSLPVSRRSAVHAPAPALPATSDVVLEDIYASLPEMTAEDLLAIESPNDSLGTKSQRKRRHKEPAVSMVQETPTAQNLPPFVPPPQHSEISLQTLPEAVDSVQVETTPPRQHQSLIGELDWVPEDLQMPVEPAITKHASKQEQRRTGSFGATSSAISVGDDDILEQIDLPELSVESVDAFAKMEEVLYPESSKVSKVEVAPAVSERRRSEAPAPPSKQPEILAEDELSDDIDEELYEDEESEEFVGLSADSAAEELEEGGDDDIDEEEISLESIELPQKPQSRGTKGKAEAPAAKGAARLVGVAEPPPPQHASNGDEPVIKPRAQGAAAKSSGRKPLQAKGYIPPSLDLLDRAPPHEVAEELVPEYLLQNAKVLEQTLENFGVRGQVKEILPGPVITLYEYLPEPGIKVSKIAALADDLAMALHALQVRVIAPIPGKGVVGIELPNKTRENVVFREILEDEQFQSTQMKLPLAMGKDTTGIPYITNLAKMPHLLIAGTTGSGKSVGVNGMICSLLYHASPEDVRFLMVDPKMLELSIYDGIPHLLLPVVTDPKQASVALAWAVNEMERRYSLMAEAGVRNIVNYNKAIEGRISIRDRVAAREDALDRVRRDAAEAMDDADGAFDDESWEDSGEFEVDMGSAKEDGSYFEKLPYIVVIIDELADLMMVAAKEVEFSIARLAQMARAAGIHLLLATQRPSVDVLTGLIKANFPSRLAFQVKSKIDSRTILDQGGAEKLLGAGDMLLVPPGSGSPIRLHGAFLSDEEIHRIVKHLKAQGEPDYNQEILAAASAGAEEEVDEEVDPVYDQGVDIVLRTRNASISHLQRKLRIGYNRAARLVEQMERDQIVGPQIGNKPREILVPPPQD